MMRKGRSTWFVLLALVAAPAAFTSCTGGGEAPKSEAPAAEALFDAEDRLALAKSPMKGNPRALVTIVEFSSYQCPFCGRVQPTLKQVAEEFGDNVRFVFKQHPLPMQANSRPAARAALAANAQGKFWEFHELLLANQSALTEENFVAWARQVGLDVDKFNADRNADWTNAQVDADLAVARSSNIRGTPNFLINGKPVTGARPFDAFASVIREEITATKALVDAGKSIGEAYGERLAANQKAAAEAAAVAQAPAGPVTFKLDGAASKGPDDAKVTLVDFSDFQCGFCGRLSETMDEVMPEFEGKSVRFVSMQFPLGRFPHSQKAAEAALAAAAQGKYWEYKKLVYQNQRALTDESFEQFAEQLGMDMERFRKEMEDKTWAAAVSAQRSEGQKGGVTGTPALFLNGLKIGGALPAESLRSAINEALG
jgi:protein-disulfide isomerase